MASGVVYPWAIVEIARAYRFRNIGGTSVGAMAAALAAAAEYGRRTGYDGAFERAAPPARRARRATAGDGRTRMLSLFQTNPRGRRLLERLAPARPGRPLTTMRPIDRRAAPVERAAGGVGRVLRCVVRAYAEPLTWIALAATAIGVAVWWLIGLAVAARRGFAPSCCSSLPRRRARRIRVRALDDVKDGVIDNNLGLCKGGTWTGRPEAKRPGISEWLHAASRRAPA